MKSNLIGFGSQRGLCPFLALPYSCAVAELLYEGVCSPSQHPHPAQTSDYYADTIGPICST
jgi:hypothetical protein